MMVKVPLALSHEGWDDWESATRSKHPVWFWCHWTVPRFFGRIQSRLRDAKWWVLHRIHPQHRYHIARTGLHAGYHDPDEVILHAAFTQLESFYECWNWKGDAKAYADAHCEHIDAGPARDQVFRHRYHFASTVEELHAYWTMRKDPSASTETLDGEEKLHLRDDKMLHKLITVRRGLWN
jgi:hypothetical protein